MNGIFKVVKEVICGMDGLKLSVQGEEYFFLLSDIDKKTQEEISCTYNSRYDLALRSYMITLAIEAFLHS